MIRSHLRSLRAYVIAAAALSLGSACSGDDGGSATASSTGESSSSAGGTESTSAGTETVGESESTSESTTGEATEREGCEGAKLLINPEDPALPGPWPVGARTVTIAERTTEIWYPAEPGSAAGVEPEVYDIRLYLPPEEQGKIPDDAAPWQACGCYRDLPLDTDHGPYPVIVFIHGTAGFRTQSLTFMTHWASRGFVVVSSDHTGITLADVLGGNFGADQSGDAAKVLDALAAPSGETAFLAGHIDLARVGMSGHSAGGSAIAGFGGRPGVQVLAPMAAGGASPGAALKSTLVLGGMVDKIVAYGSQQSGYASAAPRKRLVGLSAAGHLAFSDLCVLGADQGGILQIALDYGVNVPPLLIPLAKDGCAPENLSAEEGFAITQAASSAAFEETLHCDDAMTAALAGLPARYPAIGEFQEAL
jgi:dienelactone hydrolase